jgi:hypothetical protein
MTSLGAVTTLDSTRICEGLHARMGAREDRGIRVLVVYRSAVDLVTEDGALIAIVPERVGGLPNGILVHEAPDFRTLGIRPGTAARMDAASLRLGGSSGLVVRLGAASAWSPRVPAMDGRPWPARSILAHGLARGHRVQGGLDAIAGSEPTLHALATAINGVDRPMAARAARQLIGLGPGLTPSGDDALAGVEAALHALRHPICGFLGAALGDVEARTTTVSVALLRHAAQGEAAERIHRLLAALLAPTTTHMDDAIREAVAWGATSGSDTLLGVLLGLNAATGLDAATGTATRRVAA